MKYFRWTWLVILLLLLLTTTVSAAYIGPRRDYEYIVNYQCKYTAKLVYNSKTYYCTMELTESSCNTSGKESYFKAAQCGWPVSCGSGGTCTITVDSTPNTQSGTYPPATASGSFGCTTWGNNGWCRSGGALNVSGSEPLAGKTITQMEGNYDNSSNAAVSCSGSSCSFTPPQGQGTFWYWAVSSYGDTSTKYSLAYKFDSVSPSVTFSSAGTSGNNGWYRSNVTVTASGSDATSGLSTLTTSCGNNPCTVSAEGQTTISATATDAAGNSGSNSITIKKDTVAPSVSFTPSGTAGNNGWYRSNVTVTASGSDATSGVSTLTTSCGSNPCTVSTEGQTTISATATDAAGNSGSNNITIKKDTVAPSVSFTPSGTAGNNGWYRSNVTVTASGSDATSGVSTLTTSCGSNPCTVSADGQTTISATATDAAGNSGSNNITIKKDTVAPAITFTPSGTGGNNGWYRSAVSLSASGSDSTSGLASLSLSCGSNPCTISAEGNTSVTATAADNAGNSANNSTTIKIDTVIPNATLNIPQASGLNGWHTGNVTVTVSGNDPAPGSGISSNQVRLSGGSWNNDSLTILADGVHTIEGRSVDVAGNTSIVVGAVIKRDTAAPSATLNIPTPDGKNGWFVSTPTITASGSDATSGLAVAQVRVNGGAWQDTATLSSDGIYTVEGRSQDNAGWLSNVVSQTVMVDGTSPSASFSLPAVNGQNGWYVGDVRVVAVGEDATSGVAEREVRIGGGAWQNGEVTVTADGVHEVVMRVVDNAGNVSTATTTIKRDATPPTIDGVRVEGNAGANGWYRGNVVVYGQATDQTSGVREVLVNGQNSLVLGEGTHEILVQAIDQAGNVSMQTQSVKVDNTPPSFTPVWNGLGGENGWYAGSVVIDGHAGDVASGVYRVRARLNGGEWQSLPITVQTHGVYEVMYEIEDYAGNTRTETYQFGVDTLPPPKPVEVQVLQNSNECSVDLDEYTLSWQAPTDVRFPISRYDIAINDQIVGGAGNSHVVRGLPFGKNRVKVRSVNINGFSDWVEVEICRANLKAVVDGTRPDVLSGAVGGGVLSLGVNPTAIQGREVEFLVYPASGSSSPSGLLAIMPPTVFNATVVSTGESIHEFASPIQVTYRYDENRLQGASPYTLSFYYNDPQNGWVKIPTTLDKANRTLVAYLDHFSEYGVFGQDTSFDSANAVSSLTVFGLQPLAVVATDVDFGAQVLTGELLVIQTTADGWTAVDPTGTGQGWHVNISASDFNNEGHVISRQNLSVRVLPQTIEEVYGNTPPSSVSPDWQPLLSEVKILTANPGDGMGTYRFSPHFQLVVPANAYRGVYVAGLTVNIIASP